MNVSPQITPKFAPVTGGGDGRQARLESLREKQQSTYADTGVGATFV